jgi:hypothetical protein
MKKITAWFRAWNARSRKGYNDRLYRQIEREAKRDIQPLVWNGKVYLAYCGTPIILAERIKTDLLESVQQSQDILISYRTKERD